MPRQIDLSGPQVFRKAAKFLEGALPKSHVVFPVAARKPYGVMGAEDRRSRGGIGLPMERPEVERGGGHVGFGQGQS